MLRNCPGKGIIIEILKEAISIAKDIFSQYCLFGITAGSSYKMSLQLSPISDTVFSADENIMTPYVDLEGVQ